MKLVNLFLTGLRKVVGIMLFSERKIKDRRFLEDCDIILGGWELMQFFLWLLIAGILLGIFISSTLLVAMCSFFFLVLLIIVLTTPDLDVREIYKPPEY